MTSLDELRAAAEDGRLRDVPGFGPKAEENVLAGARRRRRRAPQGAHRCSRRRSTVGEELVGALRDTRPRCASSSPGSARRMADTVKDLDIVAATSRPGRAGARRSRALPVIDVVRLVGRGRRQGGHPHRACRWTCGSSPEEAFGNLLQHFTGSGKHNEALRTEAVRRGLHVSEYGIADDAGETRTRAPPRRRSTSGSGCSTSRRSCARTAASSRPRARASCPS